MTRYRQRAATTHRFDATRNNNSHSPNLNPEQDQQNDEDKGLYASEYLREEASAGGIFVQRHIIAFLLQQLIYSRIFLIFFQSAINFVMKDAATDAFKGIDLETEDSQNWLIHALLSGLCRWDARHFLHIAEFGYLWESNLAFFPLFPTILRILGGILHHAVSQMISLFSAMLIAGAALNNCLFVLNGLLLFRLALILNGGNLKEAILVVYIHCWCPASIFYSALYTESLYFTLTLLGLLHLHSAGTLTRSHLVVASAIFSLAFLTRSNGLINVGFVGFQLLLDAIIIRRDGQIEFRECAIEVGRRLAKNFAFFLLCFAIMSLPLRVFEFAIQDKFCSLRSIQPDNFVEPHLGEYLHSAASNNRQIVLPGDNANLPWCNDSSIPSNLLLPSFYPHIQQKYWDVGLFAYWQWKKLPLFMLAAPTLWLAIYGAYQQTFGLLSTDLRSIPEILADRGGQLIFACHTIFLAFSGLIFYNVEVSIRLLFSSSPFLYMVIAHIIADQTPNLHRLTDLMNSPIIPFFRLYMRAGWLPMCIFCYLFGFFIFGTMMHVNWFPFV